MRAKSRKTIDLIGEISANFFGQPIDLIGEGQPTVVEHDRGLGLGLEGEILHPNSKLPADSLQRPSRPTAVLGYPVRDGMQPHIEMMSAFFVERVEPPPNRMLLDDENRFTEVSRADPSSEARQPGPDDHDVEVMRTARRQCQAFTLVAFGNPLSLGKRYATQPFKVASSM